MSSAASSHKRSSGEAADQFPVGLRVLVVDDDVTTLRILEQMLRKCLYYVKTCSQAVMALKLLREQKGFFDVVLSDVHMDDMDGFKLLEHVGLESDLPVIMMSVDMNTSTVMRGVKHGACDYLIKPISMEALKNIWQHVVRKKWNEHRLESSGRFDESDCHKRECEDVENALSVSDGGNDMVKSHRKTMNAREDDAGELESDDPGTSKKPRVVWSVELHQQFVSAVNQLGIDKAVPKRILELMNVPGLTRENVASHLQKYRLYMKRISGMAQQRLISNPLCGQIEPNLKLGSALGRLDMQTMAALGHVPPQTLAALHADLLGQPPSSLSMSAHDPASLLQASLHGSKPEPFLSFGQSLPKCQAGFSRTFLPVPLNTASWQCNADSAAIDSIPPLPSINAPQAPIDPSPLLDTFHNYSYNLLSPAVSSFSLSAQDVPGFGSNPNVGGLSDHGLQWNSGRVGGAYIPTRFAVDESELSRSGSSNCVKAEPAVEATELCFGKNDLMSVFSKIIS